MITMCGGHPKRQLSTLEEWEALRTQFSHDWLLNGLAITLGKVSSVLNGAVDDPGAFSQLSAFLKQWPEYREQAFSVMASACDVLSPKRFLISGLLSVLDGEDKHFFGEIADSAWRRTQQPESVVRQADQALHELDMLTIRMADALETARETCREERGDMQALVDEMRQAVARLSAVMSKLGQCRRF